MSIMTQKKTDTQHIPEEPVRDRGAHTSKGRDTEKYPRQPDSLHGSPGLPKVQKWKLPE